MAANAPSRYRVVLEGSNYRAATDGSPLLVGWVTTRVVGAGSEEAAIAIAKAIVARDLEARSITPEPSASISIAEVTVLSGLRAWLERVPSGFTLYEI